MNRAQDPLDGLGRVSWSDLEHAYGPAEDTPDRLRALRDGDEEERKEAQYWLSASIHHQGTLYPATAPAVPFLVRLARHSQVPERAWITRFLADLAVSHPNQWLWAGFDLTSPQMAQYFSDPEAAPARESYEAVEHALPEILALLEDPEAEVRANAALCASFFARRAADVRASMRRALEREREETVIGSLLMGLALQDNYLEDRASQEAMRSHLSGSGPLALVAAAALSYGEAPGIGADPAALSVLGSALQRDPPAGTWPGFPWSGAEISPWGGGDPLSLGLSAVYKHIPREEYESPGAKVEAVQAIYFSLMERIHDDSSERELALARQAMPPLFRTVTPEPPPESGWTLATLRPTLRRFAEAVVRRPYLASQGLFEALAENGLPADFRQLGEFLGIAEPDPLAIPLAVGGDSRPLRAWLEESKLAAVADRVAEAAARTEAPVALAIALVQTQGGELVGNYGTMTFKMTPGPEAPKPAAVLADKIVASAAATDPQRTYAEGLRLAQRFAKKGPPRTYGHSGMGDFSATSHPSALTLLCDVAAFVHARTGQLPDDVFDVMIEGELGSEAAWPRIERYLKLLPKERRVKRLFELANRDFTCSWDDGETLDVDDARERLAAMVPEALRPRFQQDSDDEEED
jgi:hypothetical protein